VYRFLQLFGIVKAGGIVLCWVCVCHSFCLFMDLTIMFNLLLGPSLEEGHV